MPMSVVELCACWQGRFGCHLNGYIWIVVPHCLMWCIWKERIVGVLKAVSILCLISSNYFLWPYWTGSQCGETNHFLQFWIYLIYIIFVFDMYTPVCSMFAWVSLFFISINFYYLSKKIYYSFYILDCLLNCFCWIFFEFALFSKNVSHSKTLGY